MDKKELRNRIRAEKRAMTLEQIEASSAVLAEKFYASAQYAAAKTIYGYLPYNQEVRTVQILERAMADGKLAADQSRNGARQLSGWISALLDAYGSAPKPGEFKDGYAARLQKEYLDVFGKPELQDLQSPDGPVELISETDFGEIFDALAAEEFGNGMTEEQLRETAAFYIRLRSAAKQKMSPCKRIFCHYVKRLI